MDNRRKNVTDLLAEVMENPDIIDELTEEELLAVKKSYDPYNTVESDISYINLSITNWRDKYFRRFYATAFIGFVYRLLVEYEPLDEFTDKMTDEEKKKKTNLHRDIIERFLNRNFNYNPDRHVRSAKKESLGNKQIKDCIANISKVPVEKELKHDLISDAATIYQTLTATISELSKAVSKLTETAKILVDNQLSADAINDNIAVITKKIVNLRETRERYSQTLSEKLAHETEWAFRRIPPQDTFYNFDRYIVNHYEELRKTTEVLYNETPDIEFSVIYYAPEHKDEESAREFRSRNQKDFKTDVFTVRSRGVNMLGPFKENREKMDYYNTNTDILKQMMDQNESDAKIGNELMEKKVKVQKTESIRKVGPDAVALGAYSQTMGSVLDKQGAKKILSKEEEAELRKEWEKTHPLVIDENKLPSGELVEHRKFEQTDGILFSDIEQNTKKLIEVKNKEKTVPISEALQIDVFQNVIDENGDMQMKKSTFHSESIAPEPMQQQK